MEHYFHSVRLDRDKCTGCTHCLQRCPTQAIRIRDGKANILGDRCIDCGECIRVCPHKAKYAVRDTMDALKGYKYTVALPAPSLYGQVSRVRDANLLLNALLELGFDDVFEVAAAAERISDATKKFLRENKDIERPLISSACPAIVRLISVWYPNLIERIIPLHSPMEEAGRLAREKAVKDTGLPSEDIGIFFITPCPAKVTAIKQSKELVKSNVDGAIAINDIYGALVNRLSKLGEQTDLQHAGIVGISWGMTGGEASGMLSEDALAVDGIENCMKLLDEIENEKLSRMEFVELNACMGGCVGGVLTAENPYIAKSRLQHIRKYLPMSMNSVKADEMGDVRTDIPVEPSAALKLADNLSEAMEKMNRLNEILERLPHMDCGTCGAPSCRALAEDIVRGFGSEKDCIFAGVGKDLTPPPLRGTDRKGGE